MWEATVDGRVLQFRLWGINNQNFIMRDEETGSWWQQVSGECIFGELKGKRLKLFDHDELTFATWKREGEGGRVLRPDPRLLAKNKYAPADWERRMQGVPVATTLADPNEKLPARTLVVGVEAGGAATRATSLRRRAARRARTRRSPRARARARSTRRRAPSRSAAGTGG